MEQDRDWAAIEYDFVDGVLNKLLSVYDYLQFSLVCKSWNFVALRNRRQRYIISSNVPQLPMLIVPSKDGIHKKHSLYDLRNNQVRDVDFKIPYNRRCCGSSHGWLFLLEETMNITLFNPFSGSLISLPQITKDLIIDSEDDESGDDEEIPFDNYQTHIRKAILTKDPSLYPDDYMVAAIYGDRCKLCIVKANDKDWTYLNPNDNIALGDVTVHNDVVYVLNDALVLWKVEVDNDGDGTPTFYNLKRLTPELKLEDVWGRVYLVESTQGELLLVKRSLEFESANFITTLDFYVFKLTLVCEEDGMQRHVEVESLDKDAMFIGHSHSMCVSTEDFPKCLPNRIYYADDNYSFGFVLPQGKNSAGTFNLEDRSLDTPYIMDGAHKDFPPPIWIVPTMHFEGDC